MNDIGTELRKAIDVLLEMKTLNRLAEDLIVIEALLDEYKDLLAEYDDGEERFLTGSESVPGVMRGPSGDLVAWDHDPCHPGEILMVTWTDVDQAECISTRAAVLAYERTH